MSLPIVLEIAVGLIFIYLTLSLVASEIQEILSALFQWRAEHLKRSIEQLLAGDNSPSGGRSGKRDRSQNRRAAKTLADRLYESPLIENLNYEAQGRLPQLMRGLLHVVGAIYRTLTFSRNVFGSKTSGPSYIPAETFATSLIERLKLADFQRILVRSRFDEFLTQDVSQPLYDTVHELRARLQQEELLAAEMVYFDRSLAQTAEDLATRRLTLDAALAQTIGQIQAFEAMAAEAPLADLGADPATIQSFLTRLRYLRASVGGTDTATDPGSPTNQKTAALLTRLRPSLADLTALLDPSSPTYKELVALAQREGDAARNALETLEQEVLPPRLAESLSTLASRAEARVRAAGQATGDEIGQLQAELEGWFNNGMERASGVYRRNVKGVGLLVGLAISFTLNADTIYMFQRLTTDQAIRSSILQTAEQLQVRDLNSPQEAAEALSIDELSARMEGDLRSVGTAVEETLADYPLPIGRAESVLSAQQAGEASWPVPVIPQRLVGWGITALALSMGASFWFDLLRKVTSVRASGNPPQSQTK